MAKISIIAEFFRFLKARKKMWLAPIILILLILGVIVVLAEGSVIAPFIYTLF